MEILSITPDLTVFVKSRRAFITLEPLTLGVLKVSFQDLSRSGETKIPFKLKGFEGTMKEMNYFISDNLSGIETIIKGRVVEIKFSINGVKYFAPIVVKEIFT